jgi:hypothetical protein
VSGYKHVTYGVSYTYERPGQLQNWAADLALLKVLDLCQRKGRALTLCELGILCELAQRVEETQKGFSTLHSDL